MNKGFGTLFIIIVLGSFILAFSLWLSTSNFWMVKQEIDSKESSRIRYLVNSCAEVALDSMRADNNYVGSGNLTIGSDTCSYVVTNGGGNNRTINVTGGSGNIVKKIQINTTSFNPINISSWQDVQ